MNNEWRIKNINFDPLSDTPELDARIYVLFADRITQDGWRSQAAIGGYCEVCEENGERGDTLVDYFSISDPIDHTQNATCLRCGFDKATPYYDGCESKGKLVECIAQALFPRSFAPGIGE